MFLVMGNSHNTSQTFGSIFSHYEHPFLAFSHFPTANRCPLPLLFPSLPQSFGICHILLKCVLMVGRLVFFNLFLLLLLFSLPWLIYMIHSFRNISLMAIFKLLFSTPIFFLRISMGYDLVNLGPTQNPIARLSCYLDITSVFV